MEGIRKRFKVIKAWQLIVFSVLIVVSIVLLCSFAVRAAELLPSEELVEDGKLFFKRYPIDHYHLDFVVEDEGILDFVVNRLKSPVYFGVFMVTQFMWLLGMMVSKLAGFLIGYAYEMDIISDIIDLLARGMQTLFGFSSEGFSSRGFLPSIFPLMVLILGGYVIYLGFFRRKHTEAFRSVLNYVLVFVLSVVFIMGAPTYIRAVNDFTMEVSNIMLDAGISVVDLSGGSTGDAGYDAAVADAEPAEKIAEMLFRITIRDPWLFLQFGDTDETVIGEERVNALESLSANGDDIEARQEVLAKEVAEYGNTSIVSNNVAARFAAVFVMTFINLIISVFVSLLAVLLIIGQVLFIFFAFILPVFFIVALLPGKERILYSALARTFSYLVMKIGISLVVSIAFSLSRILFIYTLGQSILIVGIMQVVCFWTVYRSLGSILEMIGGDTAARESGETQRRVKEKGFRTVRRVRYAHRAVKAVAGRIILGAVTGGASEVSGAGEAVTGYADKKNKKDMEKINRRFVRQRNASDLYSPENSSQAEDLKKSNIRKVNEDAGNYQREQKGNEDRTDKGKQKSALASYHGRKSGADQEKLEGRNVEKDVKGYSEKSLQKNTGKQEKPQKIHSEQASYRDMKSDERGKRVFSERQSPSLGQRQGVERAKADGGQDKGVKGTERGNVK